MLYYAIHLVALLFAVLLPFVMHRNPTFATILSVAISLATAIDFVVKPGYKFQIYSRASFLLAVELLKQEENYAQYEPALLILMSTENALLANLGDIDQPLKKLKEIPETSSLSVQAEDRRR